MSEPDYIEVSRKAHELMATHGAFNAFAYAERQQALAAAQPEEHAFWKAVADSLKQR